MTIIINTAIIAFVVCYIVDISGAIQKANIAVFRRLYGKYIDYNGWNIPVISCSRCCVWWILLFYTLVFTDLNVIYSLGISAFWSYISPIVTLLLNRLIACLSDLLISDTEI
jgi:hypothetical protein